MGKCQKCQNGGGGSLSKKYRITNVTYKECVRVGKSNYGEMSELEVDRAGGSQNWKRL